MILKIIWLIIFVLAILGLGSDVWEFYLFIFSITSGILIWRSRKS